MNPRGRDSGLSPSDSAVFHYQAKLINRSGSGLLASEFGGQATSRPGHALPSKRNSIDVGSVRGKWEQREAEERKLFEELGAGPRNAVPRPGAGPMSPGTATSFSSVSSRVGSIASSRPMSPDSAIRSPSIPQSDSLQRLLHRRAKSYVPALKSLSSPANAAEPGVESRQTAEPTSSEPTLRNASSSTAFSVLSDRMVSSSTTTSANPLLPDITGSSTASSSLGPNGERKYRSSYMARKEGKRRELSASLHEDEALANTDVARLEAKASPVADGFVASQSPEQDKRISTPESIMEKLDPLKKSVRVSRLPEASLDDSNPLRTPTKSVAVLSKPPSPDEDLSPTVKAFRERIKNEGPLYKPDMSPSRSLRKRVSTSLLGEPYWPNPNPVGGSNRTPAWKPSDSTDMFDLAAKRHSPLASSFKIETPTESINRLPLKEGKRNITPVSSKSAFKSVVVPPLIPSSVYGNARRPSTLATAPGKRYGSIGKTDGRKLGKHLPRIASGDQFSEDWEEEQAKLIAKVEAKEQAAGVSSRLRLDPSDAPVEGTQASKSQEPVNKTIAVKERVTKPVDEPNHRFKTIKPEASPQPQDNPITPKRILPDGRGMQGLVGKGFGTPLASPGISATPPTLQRNGSVAGIKGRLRLSKLPASSTSASIAPAPLPSRRLNMNWMDRQRKELIAYEYLCHVGEAQQWIEGCLDEELGYGVVEMEESMTDGVALARLARKYEGNEVVRTIWEDKKHRFRQSDNIVHFLNFIRNIGMPETFIFETTDLYNKKNMPKVIYCIHVLSHLLARLGMADKIGNLVGQFDFSDEQLAQTQQGLKGLAMPNFNSVSTALAKECNIEAEEDVETEEEERDRLLLECEPAIIQLQAFLRGFIQRQATSRLANHLQLATPSVFRFQARARGALTRKVLAEEMERRIESEDWAVMVQAQARGILRRSQNRTQLQALQSSEQNMIQLQSAARGALSRHRRFCVQRQLAAKQSTIIALQALCRKRICLNQQQSLRAETSTAGVSHAITSFQAALRAKIVQKHKADQLKSLSENFTNIAGLQAQVRGVLYRKKLRVQVQTLDNTAEHVISFQAAARGHLVRRQKRVLAVTLSHCQPAVVSLQSLARARLANRAHKDMQKALSKVEVASSIGGFQSLLRSKLASKKTTEQKKQLEFVQPDVIGFQSLARGVLARRDYQEWLEYLKDDETQLGITFCQQLLRGHLARQRYWGRLAWYHSNLPKITKVQAIWRGRKQRDQYRKIVSGQDIDIAAIQSFMHLLDDSENDFAEEIQVERLRKQVIENIQVNQVLESQVTELDTKIALILQNRLSFEDLVRVKGIVGNLPAQHEEQSFSLANSDPFSHSATLERARRRKLELYQHLFFLLQTQPKYLARLIRLQTANQVDDQGRRLLQGVVLALYSYGQSRREEYLLLKLLQLAIHEQILTMESAKSLIDSRLVVTDIALAFIRPKHGAELKNILGSTISEILKMQDLDLCIDPVEIYHRIINDEESESGVISQKPRDVDAQYAVMRDPKSGQAFFQQMAALQLQTDSVLTALYKGTKHIPYTVRCMAREMLLALQVKTQYKVEDIDLIPVIARSLVLPYILPGIIAPETQGVVASLIGALPRQNVTEIANLITMIATGCYRVISWDLELFGTLENYVLNAQASFCDWILEVASVEDVETHLQTQELVEVSVAPKPITLTRAEIYAMHNTLRRELDLIAISTSDPLRPILEELGGVPNVLYQEGQTAPVTFSLTNRFSAVSNDPLAGSKADWVQAKRHILATLRVQSGKTLIDVLTRPVAENDEWIWEDVVEQDVARERARKHKSSLPPVPMPSGTDYRLEDIRSLPFREVKARAIQYCMKLEKEGMLSRETNWQDLLDDVAGDIRTQNKNRQRRKKDNAAMSEAMVYTSDKKAALEEQIASYNKYISSAMDTMQKQGKKRFVWPLSKQARHLRSMQKAGKAARFGSYRYSAVELYEKHILLPVEQTSPRQFEKFSVILSSDEVGVFTIEIVTPTNQMIGACEVKMEDLLQAKFDNQVTLDMFDQIARVRVNTLIFLINKKFYA